MGFGQTWTHPTNINTDPKWVLFWKIWAFPILLYAWIRTLPIDVGEVAEPCILVGLPKVSRTKSFASTITWSGDQRGLIRLVWLLLKRKKKRKEKKKKGRPNNQSCHFIIKEYSIFNYVAKLVSSVSIMQSLAYERSALATELIVYCATKIFIGWHIMFVVISDQFLCPIQERLAYIMRLVFRHSLNNTLNRKSVCFPLVYI